MEFEELQVRLRQIDVVVKDGTLRRWATTKLIAGPERFSKSGTQGQFWDWPEEAVEDAAAVWALKNLDTYWANPNHNAIRRVKHKAKELHELYTKHLTLDKLAGDEYRKDVTPKGETGTFFHSYDLHPLLIIWITTIEKVRHKVAIKENRLVTFCWVKEKVQGETKLAFHGVKLGESDKNELKISWTRSSKK
jgi:hypothetical protein